LGCHKGEGADALLRAALEGSPRARGTLGHAASTWARTGARTRTRAWRTTSSTRSCRRSRSAWRRRKRAQAGTGAAAPPHVECIRRTRRSDLLSLKASVVHCPCARLQSPDARCEGLGVLIQCKATLSSDPSLRLSPTRCLLKHQCEAPV